MEPLQKLLTDASPQVRAATANGLGLISELQAAVALTALTTDGNFEVRITAAIALFRLDKTKGIQEITACLTDEDRDHRERAAIEVSSSALQSETLIEPLAAALADENIRVRIDAASALGKIGTPAAVDVLLANLSDKENLWHISEALTTSQDPRAIGPLIQGPQDSREKIREVTATCLGELGNSDGATALIRHTDDHSPNVKVAVLKAIMKLDPEKARSFVQHAAQDPNPMVRSYAERAIRMAGR